MARTWFLVRVELVSGRGITFWPRPGRLFVVGPHQTFDHLATAIDTAFARWDLAHLHSFRFEDGTTVGPIDAGWEDPPEGTLSSAATKLRRLVPGEQFAYDFDFGDDWLHLCTVADQKIDPNVEFGGTPHLPWVVFGGGDIPDQYGRRWLDDDDENHVPGDTNGADLPSFLNQWG